MRCGYCGKVTHSKTGLCPVCKNFSKELAKELSGKKR